MATLHGPYCNARSAEWSRSRIAPGFSLRSLNSAFTLVHSCHELEQGFNIRMTGPQSRPLFDMDGLLLTSRVPQDDEPELDEEDTEDAA